jgi:excisionase family DNA binding protein
MTTFEQLLTPQDVSKLLQIKLSTIYKWTSSGYIPCVKLGGKVRGSVRFVRLEIMRWVRKRARHGRDTYRLDIEKLMK